MSFSSGTFSLVAGNPVVTGTTISSTVQNNTMNDVATGLSTCILKDGTQTATAIVPFAQGINSTLVTDSTTSTTGSIITAGGIGVAKAINVGTTLGVTGLTTLTGGVNLTSVASTSFVKGTTASTFTFDGGGGSSGSITMTWQVVGNFCTLTLQAVIAGAGTSSTVLTSNTALPAAQRPVANTSCEIPITNNNSATNAPGLLVVNTAGLLFIYRDPTGLAFANSANAGLQQGISITYALS